MFVCFWLCYKSVFSFVGLQYGDCPLMVGYSEQGTGRCGESFELVVIVKNCITVGSVRRSGRRWVSTVRKSRSTWTTCDK